MYPFVNSVWSHFIKIIYFFYGKHVNQKYVAMSICRFFWPNLDIINFIFNKFVHRSLNYL